MLIRTKAVAAALVSLAGLAAGAWSYGRAGALPEGIAVVGRFEAKDIKESSGIVASRRHPGILYTHNDSGGAPVIFAVKADGTVVKQYRVPANHTDWEDIATDDAGRLYIANTGNNDGKREAVEVFRVAEPDPAETPKKKRKSKNGADGAVEERLRVERTWRLKFPGAPFNCESLFVLGEYAYLVSKLPEGERAAIYRFSIAGGTREPALEKVADLVIRRPITGASVSPDGRRLALVSSDVGATLYLFEINGDVAAAGMAEPKRVRLPSRQIEAVAFTPDGIVMTAETREIYRYTE